MQRVRRGDLTGLPVLIELYQLRALRTAYLITWERAQAEDLVQAAFVQLPQRLQTYDLRRPFEPWFLRLVANDALQLLRRSQRWLSLDDPLPGSDTDLTFADLLPDPGLSPDAHQEAGELRASVQQALAALPAPQRAAIVLRYYADMSEEDMAGLLNTPPGTIKWRLHAARQHLKRLLQPLWEARHAGRKEAQS